MSFKILDMCVGSYLTTNRIHIISTIFVHKNRLYCVKKLLLILDIIIVSTFEHVYIIILWCLIDFSAMNDNANVLFEMLFLSGKLLYFIETWKSTCRSQSCKTKLDFLLLVQIYPKVFCEIFWMLEMRFHSLSRSLLIDF